MNDFDERMHEKAIAAARRLGLDCATAAKACDEAQERFDFFTERMQVLESQVNSARAEREQWRRSCEEAERCLVALVVERGKARR